MSEFKVERDGAVLVLTLARAEKKNALTGAMYEAFDRRFRCGERRRRASPRCLIEGSGGVFSAGNDIGDFIAYASAAGRRGGRIAGGALHLCAGAIRQAVGRRGGRADAVGLGDDAVLPLRPRLCEPSARFHMPFVDLGLAPEAGSSCSRRCASARPGREDLLLGEPFDAEAARPAASSTPSSTPPRCRRTRSPKPRRSPPSRVRRCFPPAASFAATKPPCSRAWTKR